MLEDGEFIEAIVFEYGGKFYEFIDSASVEAVVTAELDGEELAKRYSAELEKWLVDNKVKVGDIMLLIREVPQKEDPNLN